MIYDSKKRRYARKLMPMMPRFRLYGTRFSQNLKSCHAMRVLASDCRVCCRWEQEHSTVHCWLGNFTGDSNLGRDESYTVLGKGKMPWKKVSFSHPKGDKNKKGSPLRPQYLVNLKSNTMKNTHANIEIIYDTRKFFLAKDPLF